MPERQIHFNYVLKGSGKPVLLIHGFLESLTMWDNIDLLDNQMITVDLPGHGASPDQDYIELSEIAKGLRSLMSELMIGHYHVVGHSMGGYIALELKALDPKCEKVILLNSNFWGDSDKKKLDRQRVAKLVEERKDHFVFEAIPGLFYDPHQYDSQVKNLISDARKMSSKAIATASLAMMRRPDHTDLIQKYKDDVYIVQGDQDTLTTLDLMKEKLGVHLENYILIHSSHMSWVEHPGEVTEILREIL